MSARLTTSTVALVTAALLALTGCAGSDTAPEKPSAAGASSSAAADTLMIEDAWVKAAETGMSAAFGNLKNAGTQDVTVVSVTTPASMMVELHETVKDESGEMVMREKDGGFTIPAGGSLLLEPGANHIMLMDLAEPMVAGAQVTFTLTFADTSTLELTAPVKDYSGANENYEGGEMEMGDMGAGTEMDHAEMDHAGMDMNE